MSDPVEQKAFLRVVRFLRRGPAQCRQASAGGMVLLEADERGPLSVASETLAAMVRQGMLLRNGGGLALSADGAGLAQRLQSISEPGAQRDIGIDGFDTADGRMSVVVNLAESPLGQLARRRTRDGQPYLTGAEVNAGERLRSDYTRGRIMPRLGANWEASVSSGRRGGGGIAELTDAALAARQRVERAIAAVGPELSGVLVDICCFLKGMEVVEVERGWPARSAKVVLKSALGVLSRHYDPAASRSRPVLHWGTADYRPSIG